MCVKRMAKSSSVRSLETLSLDSRSDRMLSSIDLAAASIMATPSTIATSSSSSNDDSSAPFTSSCATWKEMDTERSAPIDVSVEAVVPPIPESVMSNVDLKRVSSNYQTLLSGFAYCQKNLYLRELPAAAGGRGKRGRAGTPHQRVRGVVFGSTMGGILEFVAHPGVKRAQMERRVKSKVTSIAGLHARTRGEDGDLLGLGMASSRLPSKSYKHLPEFLEGNRVDTHLGSLTTLVGACVALLCVVEVISELDPPHDDDVLSPAADMAACVLEGFPSILPGRGEQAAEARAMRRIASSSRKSWEFANCMGLPPDERLLLQLRNAATAAFPSEVLDINSHTRLLDTPVTNTEVVRKSAPLCFPARLGFVSLAALSRTGEGESLGGSSTSSSSWSSIESNL